MHQVVQHLVRITTERIIKIVDLLNVLLVATSSSTKRIGKLSDCTLGLGAGTNLWLYDSIRNGLPDLI